MALQKLTPGNTWLAYDDETHEYLLCKGSKLGDFTVLGQFRPAGTISDYLGNRALVSADGALKSGDWGGAPILGTDAAGANGYATVLTVPRDVRYLHAAVGANGAIISVDGGATDAFAIPADTERLFPAQDIAAGSVIQGKNLVTSSNYVNLFVSVW